MAQKTFRDFTIDDDESHSQGSRASLTCDLLLAAFSKQIHSKTRIHTRGLSPRLRANFQSEIDAKLAEKSKCTQIAKSCRCTRVSSVEGDTSDRGKQLNVLLRIAPGNNLGVRESQFFLAVQTTGACDSPGYFISESDDVTLRRYLAFSVRDTSPSNACWPGSRSLPRESGRGGVCGAP